MQILKMILLFFLIFSSPNSCFSMLLKMNKKNIKNQKIKKKPTKKNPTENLHTAINEGNTELATLLINKGADITIKDKNGYTPLHLAIKMGNPTLATLLINKGADINAITNYNDTPLHLAAQKGNTELATLFINKGANINAITNHNDTPLHFAALNGHTELATLFINNGADITIQNIKGQKALDMQNYNGNTLLHLAVQHGNTELATLFINKGANINAITKQGNTPLHLAAQNGNTELANLLINNGANITIPNNNKDTPLHFAAQNGNTELATLLINNRADVTIQNDNGNTPLHLAALNGNTELATLLINNRADITIKNKNGYTPLDMQDNDGNTLLHLAAQNGNTELANLFINNGADITIKNNNGQKALDMQDNNGNTLLNLAAQNGNTKLATLLINNGADITIQNNNGNNPLNIKDNNGNTLLHLAAQNGNTELATLLINNGADITIKNNNGQKALDMQDDLGDNLLHQAILIDDFNCIQTLLEKNPALLNKPNKFNYTPLQTAKIINNKTINDFLQPLVQEPDGQETSPLSQQQETQPDTTETLSEEETKYSSEEFNNNIINTINTNFKNINTEIEKFRNISFNSKKALNLLEDITSILPENRNQADNFLYQITHNNSTKFNAFILGISFFLKEKFQKTLYPIIINYKNLTQQALFSCLCQKTIDNNNIILLLENLKKIEEKVASLTIPICTSFLKILNTISYGPKISLYYDANLLTPPGTMLLLNNKNFQNLQNAFKYTHLDILTSRFAHFKDGSKAEDAGGVKRAYNQLVSKLFCTKEKSVFFNTLGHQSNTEGLTSLIPQGLTLNQKISIPDELSENFKKISLPESLCTSRSNPYSNIVKVIKQKKQKPQNQNVLNIITNVKNFFLNQIKKDYYINSFIKGKQIQALKYWGLYLFYGILHSQYPTSLCAKKYYSAFECDYDEANPRIYFEYAINHDPSILDNISSEPDTTKRIKVMKSYTQPRSQYEIQTLNALNNGFWNLDSFTKTEIISNHISNLNDFVASMENLDNAVDNFQQQAFLDIYNNIINDATTVYHTIRDIFSILTASDYAHLLYPIPNVNDVIKMINYIPLFSYSKISYNNSLIESIFQKALESYIRKSTNNLSNFLIFITGTNIATNNLEIKFIPRGISVSHTCFSTLHVSLEELANVIINKVQDIDDYPNKKPLRNQNQPLESIEETQQGDVLNIKIKDKGTFNVPTKQIENALEEYIETISTGDQKFTSI